MNEPQRKNLLKLATFLNNKVPDKHFDLSKFVYNNSIEESGLIPEDIWERTHENLKKACETGKNQHCGAVGCAIGFCPVLFPKSFKYHENYVVHIKSNKTAFNAAIRFFGIDFNQALYLFAPHANYNSKKSVVKRLRQFCKTQLRRQKNAR